MSPLWYDTKVSFPPGVQNSTHLQLESVCFFLGFRRLQLRAQGTVSRAQGKDPLEPRRKERIQLRVIIIVLNLQRWGRARARLTEQVNTFSFSSAECFNAPWAATGLVCVWRCALSASLVVWWFGARWFGGEIYKSQTTN